MLADAILVRGMNHEHWMREAIEQAQLAASLGEIPVGAVVVAPEPHGPGCVVGRGHNRKETEADPTAHAEIVAIREAARALGAWRLTGTTLYCTLEPCVMCAGALVYARVERLVFAVRDPRGGAAGSVYDLVRSPWLNHRLEVVEGVLADQVQTMMTAFFESLRAG